MNLETRILLKEEKSSMAAKMHLKKIHLTKQPLQAAPFRNNTLVQIKSKE